MKVAPPLVQHRGGGPDLERAQALVRKTLEPIVGVEILQGALLSFETDNSGRRTNGIEFAAGVPKKVPHKLGRLPRGWFVVRDFGANISELLEDAGNTDATFLYLQSAVTCTVYLWAF